MIVVGDVHGRTRELVQLISRHDIKNEIFIQCGDFGIGFLGFQELLDLNYSLKYGNNKLYILRGNHDNPDIFLNKSKYSNIRFVKDYSILNIQNKKILLIGGGVSIDRIERRKNISWWENEEIIVDEKKLKSLSKKNFDILITHVPSRSIFYDVNDSLLQYWIKKDNTLIELIKKENESLDIIRSKINFKTWIAGHYHMTKKIFQEDKNYIILNELEFYEIKCSII